MKKLSKLFDNAQISLELLQRFGFFLENGRLVISERQPSHLCSAIKYLNNSDNSNSTLQQIALGTLEVIQNTILSELMDEIPDDIMDNIAIDISNCTQQNDFEKLLQLLYKTVIKYRRKNVKMYASTYHPEILSCTTQNHTENSLQLLYKTIIKWRRKNQTIPIDQKLAFDLDKAYYIAQFWQEFEKNVNYKNRKDKANIGRWLYNNQFPQAICDHILGLIDHLDLNLTVIDDRRLFIELVSDRWLCIAVKHKMYNECMGVYQLIIPYWNKVKHRDMFITSCLNFLMHFSMQNGIEYTNIQKLQPHVKTFANKWINYHDERYLSKICKVILDVNNWHEWKCYQCNMINDKHAFECIVCHKGINALYLAKCNKSQTFCVDKPFGLINHDFSQQVCIMCVCDVLFYVLTFKLSKY